MDLREWFGTKEIWVKVSKNKQRNGNQCLSGLTDASAKHHSYKFDKWD
jgi:hypothetical protein